MLALQLPQDGEAILVRQLHVHHHEVGHVLAHRLDGLGAGRRVTRRVAGILEKVGQEGADVLFVIDDEDRASRVGQSVPPSGSSERGDSDFPRLEGSVSIGAVGIRTNRTGR